MKRQVVILGSTGSIGLNTLDVLKQHPDRFNCFGLSANTDVDSMFAQCVEHKPKCAVMADQHAAALLRTKCAQQGLSTQIVDSVEALTELASEPEVDVVVSGIVGAAGLLSTLSAVKSSKTVLIANKEPLVMLGEEIVNLADKYGATLLPLDSEHNAIFQCLPPFNSRIRSTQSKRNLVSEGVRKLILTGSGGPFRTLALKDFANITPDQACSHPNWKMGKKISVDSATMMNKGLELIEACALFSLQTEKIDIVVHPQSVIHSMVEYIDGSILSQMGDSDMRVPIAHALGWPQRIESGVKSLDLISLSRLDFLPPDYERFPALSLATQAAQAGGTLPTVLSAANEVAVEAFLNKRIGFTEIVKVVEDTMRGLGSEADRSLESVLHADSQARDYAAQIALKLAA